MELLLWFGVLIAVAGCMEMLIEFPRTVVRLIGLSRTILFFAVGILAFLLLIALPSV